MTVVDLCNNALAQIAHDRVITSLTDGSTEALRCALLWPRARRSVLSVRPWKFLLSSAAPGTEGTALDGFDAAYAQPSGSLLIVGVLDNAGVQLPYLHRGGYVHVVGVAAQVLYVADDETPDNWPPTVQDAVIANLADRLGRVMQASKVVIEACAQAAAQALAIAAQADDQMPGVTQGGTDEVLDLCNNALAAAGSQRDLVSLADGSREAALCTRLYPLARMAVLMRGPWGFATQTDAAMAIESVDPLIGYDVVVAVPGGALLVTQVHDEDGDPAAFIVREGMIHVTGTADTVTFVADVEDPVMWPAPFKDAVIGELAARLARSLPGLERRALGVSVQAEELLARARRADVPARDPGERNPYLRARA